MGSVCMSIEMCPLKKICDRNECAFAEPDNKTAEISFTGRSPNYIIVVKVRIN